MADHPTAEEPDRQAGAVRQAIPLLAQRNLQREALRALLEEWTEEAGPPDPVDVAKMRRLYYPQ